MKNKNGAYRTVTKLVDERHKSKKQTARNWKQNTQPLLHRYERVDRRASCKSYFSLDNAQKKSRFKLKVTDKEKQSTYYIGVKSTIRQTSTEYVHQIPYKENHTYHVWKPHTL